MFYRESTGSLRSTNLQLLEKTKPVIHPCERTGLVQTGSLSVSMFSMNTAIYNAVVGVFVFTLEMVSK